MLSSAHCSVDCGCNRNGASNTSRGSDAIVLIEAEGGGLLLFEDLRYQNTTVVHSYSACRRLRESVTENTKTTHNHATI